ncbi:MAG TPA: hypothetical protein VNT04_06750 [Gaiellaceae bacterium]|nr:hypothetical protein [Gaiellaceae bacterium]
MAKKARTPTPPRPVQAPKRRDTRRPSTVAEQRSRWFLYGLAALGPIALVLVLAFLFLGNDSSKGVDGDAPKIDYAALPGLQKGPAPWPPEYAELPDRLKPLGLNALSGELFTVHIHQHLNIFVDGKPVAVPASIGINDGAFITELHTHDGSGIMHLESGEKKPYALGQFFGVWGLRLTKNCIGGYCAKPGTPLKLYIDGKLYKGDPNNVVLKNHQEFAFVYGKAPKKIPSTYDWKKAGV